MSINNRKESLIRRFGFALGGIILLTFFSMLSSIFITNSITGMGSAINHAGSLRMQSFRIATDLVYRVTDRKGDQSTDSGYLFSSYVHSFDSRLHNQKIKQTIPEEPESPIYQAYQDVYRSWEYQIKPILYVYEKMGDPASYSSNQPDEKYWAEFTNTSKDAIRNRYMDLVGYFVNKIDRLVKELEIEMENQIKILHLIETSALFIALAIVLTTMLSLHTNILTPLQSLMTATERIRRGDFNYKATVTGDNELSELANTFNAMSVELADTYRSQEQEIREKTADLKQKKSAMELLYNTSTILSKAPTLSESYEQILEQINRFLNIESALICLSRTESANGFILASTMKGLVCRNGCKECHLLVSESKPDSELAIPIRDNNQSYGLLILKQNRAQLDEWQLSTLKMVSEQIGSAIAIARSTVREKENLLNLERSSIARELHDSLAQSLTYMKIEVSRIQLQLKDVNNTEVVQEIVSDVRTELNNAYRQLRELLTTFRLTIEIDELNNTIAHAVEDFRQRGDVKIMLDVRIGNCTVNPHEAIHLVYILREALSNVHKHARASNVWIELRCTPSNTITLSIQDDGVGITKKRQTEGHYGLTIMQERTKALNGTFQINERMGGGSSIEISFTPLDHHDLTTQGNITPWINQI